MTNRNLNPQTIAQLARFNVNLDQWEEIRQSLYDVNAYAAAGQTQLQYFAIPRGQGGKGPADTNMQLAGQLGTNNLMLVESIEILFFSNTPTTTAANNPAFAGVDGLSAQLNDYYFFARSGWLDFAIGQKSFLTEAPLQRFPGKTRFRLDAAYSQAGEVADATVRAAIGYTEGRPYLLGDTPILLIENQAFNVTLNWPAAVAITDPARVFVVLDGRFYRKAQ